MIEACVVDRWLITTVLEQKGARTLFPCWDEPAMKVFFDISVQHSSRFLVFSITPIQQKDVDKSNDIHVTRFRTTAPISPSLVVITMIEGILSCPMQYSTYNLWHREEVNDLLGYIRTVFDPAKRYLTMTTDVQEKKRILDFLLIPNIPVKSMGCYGLYLFRYIIIYIVAYVKQMSQCRCHLR